MASFGMRSAFRRIVARPVRELRALTNPHDALARGRDAAVAATSDRIAQLEAAATLASLFGPHGVMLSTATLSAAEKSRRAIFWQYQERAQIALAVAGNYCGGDYAEFGSDGMGTFRNFLSAYDLNQVDQWFPDTRFLAFDIFGSAGPRDMDNKESAYFSHWQGSGKEAQARDFLSQHQLYVDRCEIVPGYFQDTVASALQRYQPPNRRRIGFAFLDCNISASYRYLFGLLSPVLHPRGFVYMDEYYLNPEVPLLFRDFVAELRRTRGIGVEFVRNAGVFGALFRLMDAVQGRNEVEG